MKTIRDIEFVPGMRILVRADFNVPLKDGKISDDFRIRSVLPTIEFLRSKGARIVLVSHLESIKGEIPSLEPVAKHLNGLGMPVKFVKNFSDAFGAIENDLKPGECVLLDNLRLFDGEKDNDKGFSQQLASLADIYINEAFPVSHRKHASIVSVPGLMPSYAGLQFEKEVTNLSKAFDPQHPFLFILGGAKFETKLPLFEKFMNIADTVFVGGALAHDFYKAKGYEIGTSLCSLEDFDLGRFVSDPKLMLPVDVITQNKEEKSADGLLKTDKILDAGPKTLELLNDKISQAKFILWNGPLGLYEDGYQGATLELAKMIGGATTDGAESIVGGGDTVAAIATLGIEDKFTFISTGGGAMLDFLAKGTLLGIEALERSESSAG